MSDFDPKAYIGTSDFDPKIYAADGGTPSEHFNKAQSDAAMDRIKADTNTGGSLSTLIGNIDDTLSAQRDHAPGAELLNKAAAATMAGLGAGNGDTFEERYDDYKKTLADRAAERAKRNPTAEIVGGASSGLLTPFKGSPGLVSRAAGNVGLAAADAGTSNPDKIVDPEAAKEGGETAGKWTALFESLPFIGKGYSAATGAAREAAGELGAKAALGRNKALLKDMGENTADIGNKVFDSSGPAGKSVGWFSSPQDIEGRLQANKDFYGNQIGEIGNQVGAAGERVSKEDIASAIDDWRAKKIPEIEVRKPSADPEDLPGVDDIVTNKVLSHQQASNNALKAAADDYRSMSQNPTFNEAQDLKKTYKWTDSPNETHILPGDAQNTIKKAIGSAQEDAANAAGVGGKYRDVKDNWRSLDTLHEGAENRVAADRANNKWGLYAPIGAAGLAAGSTGDSLEDKAQRFVVGGLLYNQLKKRGPAFMANLANSAASALENGGSALGKFTPILEAAQKRGPMAFAATHDFLLKNNPEYQDILLNGGQEDDAK